MTSFSVSSVSSARRRIQVTGDVGGAITIECPVKDISKRKFWCKELKTNACVTIVSTSPYVNDDYKDRISIMEGPQEGLFQITIRRLEEDDAGLYACGTGSHNDRNSGKTLQVELKVSNEVIPSQTPNGDASYTTLGIQFPVSRTITPEKALDSTFIYARTGSTTKGIPKNSRTSGDAQPMPTQRSLRSSYGNDAFQILIPILLIILLLVASVILVRKQLQGKKGTSIYTLGCSGEAASCETYGINLRLSALEEVQGHNHMENIYSACPLRFERADKSRSHVPHESDHYRIDL
ncbi:high affinity immunoglobulin alpha and immunoglobulin mu Fc receptor-like isoform X2 [Carettochelys insculpta]|uniref:high affinity immunoglobulin alpha and immunoglobulin mu Fc receptor-like isoform X2 n=1 Tax=Carettochelys insculpta TaxID=44489 RepID=UPI003EBD8188